MNHASASGVELWNAFHRPLSNRQQAQKLATLLSDLPPGTAIEGYWLPGKDTFLASDVTFIGEAGSRGPASLIEAYRLRRPENAGKSILALPPDDWRLELFLSSDKVLAIVQPASRHRVTDLRKVAFEQRISILEDVVRRIAHPGVRLLPAVGDRFRQAYEDWKLHDFAEGVVVRHWQHRYPAQGQSTSWRHLFEWD